MAVISLRFGDNHYHMAERSGCMWPSWLERRLCMSLDLRGVFIVVPFFPGHNLVAPGG